MTSTQDTSTETPRVWIGSLAAYNAGDLVGEWVDADDLEAMEAVAAKLPGEEIALMDREGFGELIGEYTQLETVAELGAALVEHGEALRFYLENAGYSDGDDVPVGEFEDAYCGHYDGEGREYAEELAAEVGTAELDRWPTTCIDWDRAWRELTFDGYWERGGHIFLP